MPNARVGAMPNTQATNQEEYAGGRRKVKSRGQKGITMEVSNSLLYCLLLNLDFDFNRKLINVRNGKDLTSVS